MRQDAPGSPTVLDVRHATDGADRSPPLHYAPIAVHQACWKRYSLLGERRVSSGKAIEGSLSLILRAHVRSNSLGIFLESFEFRQVLLRLLCTSVYYPLCTGVALS